MALRKRSSSLIMIILLIMAGIFFSAEEVFAAEASPNPQALRNGQTTQYTVKVKGDNRKVTAYVTINGLDNGQVSASSAVGISDSVSFKAGFRKHSYEVTFTVKQDPYFKLGGVTGTSDPLIGKDKTITPKQTKAAKNGTTYTYVYSFEMDHLSYLKNFTVTLTHTHHNKTVTVPATCTQDGSETITCSICQNTTKKTLTKLGHSWGPWQTVKEPGCVTEGAEKRVCARDSSHVEERAIAATGHSMKHVDAVEPTCVDEGNTEYWTCAKCGKIFSDKEGTTEIAKEDTVIPARGHDLKKTEAKAATCTEDGNTEYYVCQVCGKIFSDKEGTKEITMEDTVIPARGHDQKKTEAKAATCTEDGNTEYYVCQVCGKIFSDKEGTTEITKEDTVIPATGHKWGDWTVVKKPTYTSEGEMRRVCENDPAHVETKSIPKLVRKSGKSGTSTTSKKSGIVKTGDSSEIGMMTAVLLIAAACAAAVICVRKRNRE